MDFLKNYSMKLTFNYSLYRNWWDNLCQKLADLSLMDLRSKHYLDERHASAMSDHFMFEHHMFPETAECEALFGSAFFAEYEVADLPPNFAETQVYYDWS